jgi:hypothetical protein
MQIVINIPEKVKQTFDNAKDEDLYGNYYDYNSFIGKAIKNGIQLPEGHGDLITKEQAIELVEFYQINPQHFSFINLIDEIKDEKPIIEADEVEE